MEALDKAYLKQLEAIAKAIQESEELSRFIDEEEDEDFKALKLTFEPQILSLYNEVGTANPRQLFALEDALMDHKFEGLFVGKLMSFAVLRTALNDNAKFARKQEEFERVINFAAASANFDYIKRDIRLPLQLGFGLSSDIWVNNLIDSLPNKRLSAFLLDQKHEKYESATTRLEMFNTLKKKFTQTAYQVSDIPTKISELNYRFKEMETVIQHRINTKVGNAPFKEQIDSFLDNEEFKQTHEYARMLYYYALFFDLNKEEKVRARALLSEAFSHNDERSNYFFQHMHSLLDTPLAPEKEQIDQMCTILIKRSQHPVSDFFFTLKDIHDNHFADEAISKEIIDFAARYGELSYNKRCFKNLLIGIISDDSQKYVGDNYQDFFATLPSIEAYKSIFTDMDFDVQIQNVWKKYIAKLGDMFTDRKKNSYKESRRFATNELYPRGIMNNKEIRHYFRKR